MSGATPEQVRILRHMLGLDRSTHAYRNRYCAVPGNPDLAAMRDAGLVYRYVPHAEQDGKSTGLEWWRATEAGKAVARGVRP